MRLHESTREEVGLVTTLIGSVVLVFGIVDRIWMWDVSYVGDTIAWLMVLIGGAATLFGLWLHATRSRKREDIHVPPRESAETQDAPPTSGEGQAPSGSA